MNMHKNFPYLWRMFEVLQCVENIFKSFIILWIEITLYSALLKIKKKLFFLVKNLFFKLFWTSIKTFLMSIFILYYVVHDVFFFFFHMWTIHKVLQNVENIFKSYKKIRNHIILHNENFVFLTQKIIDSRW